MNASLNSNIIFDDISPQFTGTEDRFTITSSGINTIGLTTGSTLMTVNGFFQKPTTENNLGVLNGVFFTDADTNKPTFANFSKASNTATDITAFVNDDPRQMYDIMSADTAFNQNEVGGCADQVDADGTSPLFISKSKISATTAAGIAQLKILGVSRDPDHSDTAAEGFALRVQIREHILVGNNTQRAGI